MNMNLQSPARSQSAAPSSSNMEHPIARKSKGSHAKKSAKGKAVAKSAEFINDEETDLFPVTEEGLENKADETSCSAGPESSSNETNPRNTRLRAESPNGSAQIPIRKRTAGCQQIRDHDDDYEMSDVNDLAGLFVDSDNTQRQHRDSRYNRNTNSERNRHHRSHISDRDRDSRPKERFRRSSNRAYVAPYVETDDEYEQPPSRYDYGCNGRLSRDYYQCTDEPRNNRAGEPSRRNDDPILGSTYERNPGPSSDQGRRRASQYTSRPRHAYYRSDDEEEASGSEYGPPRRRNDQASVCEPSISLDPIVPPGGFSVPAGAEERLPSRYSGHPNPRRVNMMPGTVRITKTGKVAKTKKNRGANDPENITIVNLYDNEERSWAYIAKHLNDKRLAKGLKPGFSANGCNNRYNRTAPVLYEAEGRTFVPVCLRNRINRDDVDALEGHGAKSGAKSPRAQANEAEADPKVASLWNEALDKELLEAEEVVKEAHWVNVAEMFNGKTGLNFTPQQLAFRRGMM